MFYLFGDISIKKHNFSLNYFWCGKFLCGSKKMSPIYSSLEFVDCVFCVACRIQIACQV